MTTTNLKKQFSAEHRQKLSDARKRFYANGGVHPRGMKGKQQSSCWREAVLKSVTGEKNYLWKGDKVSYRSLHHWVARWLGKPSKCEHCDKIGYGRKMHWANKSGKYLRDLKDWIRLCPSCHTKYDKNYHPENFKKNLLVNA